MLENLLYTLSEQLFKTPIEFKEAEINQNNTIENIKVLYGNDDYNASGLTEIEYDSISSKALRIDTPNKSKGIIGISITFKNESGLIWSKTFLSHQNKIYEQNDLLGSSLQ